MIHCNCHLAQYLSGSNSSRQITGVKHRRANTVLGWRSAWEHSVWYVSFFHLCFTVFLQFLRSYYHLADPQAVLTLTVEADIVSATVLN